MQKITLRTLTKLSLVAAATLMATGSASAITYSWTLDTATISGGTITGMSSNGVNLTAKAYSTASASSRSASSWVGATFGNFNPSGVGITNTGESGATPDHAIDNGTNNGVGGFSGAAGKIDLLVLEASTAVDWTSILAGWVGNGTTNIQAWTGGNATVGANYNFTDVCFSGTCSIGGTAKNLANLGFSAAGSFANVGTTGGNALTDGSSASRYLIVSGNIGGVDDAFKLKTITAQSSTVPEPASLALLGLGLLGLCASRRRRAA